MNEKYNDSTALHQTIRWQWINYALVCEKTGNAKLKQQRKKTVVMDYGESWWEVLAHDTAGDDSECNLIISIHNGDNS